MFKDDEVLSVVLIINPFALYKDESSDSLVTSDLVRVSAEV